MWLDPDVALIRCEPELGRFYWRLELRKEVAVCEAFLTCPLRRAASAGTGTSALCLPVTWSRTSQVWRLALWARNVLLFVSLKGLRILGLLVGRTLFCGN